MVAEETPLEFSQTNLIEAEGIVIVCHVGQHLPINTASSSKTPESPSYSLSNNTATYVKHLAQDNEVFSELCFDKDVEISGQFLL